jgi:SAM-dependent methyltransferase
MGFEHWLADLERRHLADLRVPEMTRALRALSSAYVERRHTIGKGGPLDSSGKRAAFALFYAPLHFVAATHVLQSIDTAVQTAPATILDLGCGTGAAGAAWALATAGLPRVVGIDRNAWAVHEARNTYRALGIRGTARQADAARVPRLTSGSAAVAAYLLNELPSALRASVEDQLFAAAERGIRVLVLEPMARAVAPWWEQTARRAIDAGGRADEWRFDVDLPPLLRTLDTAAGLNHRELTVRSLWLPGRPPPT